MRTRSACRCLLCQLELHLKQQLRDAGHLESYSEVAQSSLLLSGFPNAFALTEHLRACRSNGNGSHPADAVLLELLHLRRALRTDTLLRDILLLAFIPVLHSTSRQIAKQYASVPSDDAAHHLVVTFLEALDSSVLRGAPTKVVSEILGHSDVHTTMKIYQHTNTETFRGPLDSMSEALLPDVIKLH